MAGLGALVLTMELNKVMIEVRIYALVFINSIEIKLYSLC